MEHKELANRLKDIYEQHPNKEEFEKEAKSIFPGLAESVLDLVFCLLDIFSE